MTKFKLKTLASASGLAAILLSSACSLTPPKSMMDVQMGETFTLNQPITIKANSATQFFQLGKLTGRSVNRAEQHCRIEIKKLSDTAQTIHPETFHIESVRIGSEQIASNQSNAMMAWTNNGIQSDAQPNITASLWYGGIASNDGDSQPPETMDLVMLYLTPTAKNPNIFRLVCAGSLSNGDLMDAPRSYRPQREQINQILGSFGHVNP